MDTTLDRIASHAFYPESIRKANNIFRDRHVRAERIGQSGAIGFVVVSSFYFVTGLDFQDLDSEQLGVHCGCDVFEDGYLCEHVAAFMLECEREGFSFPERAELSMFECDLEDISIGTPIKKGGKSAAPKKKIAPWRRQLLSVASTHTTQNSIEQLPKLHRNAQCQTQLWFVISLADQVAATNLEIRTFRSNRKKNQEWGKLTVASIAEYEIERFEDPLERAALSLLKRHCSSSSYYDFRSSNATVFHLPTDLVPGTMQALAATGRLAWSMEASRSALDPQPIAWDDGPEFSLKLTIAPYQPEKGAQQIRLQPQLVRAEETVGIADVLTATDDGVLLLQDRACRVKRGLAAAIRNWQANPSVDVPQRSFATMMDEVASWPDISLDLHPELPLSQQIGTPVPRLHLDTPSPEELGEGVGRRSDGRGTRSGKKKPGSDALCAEIVMVYGSAEIPVESSQQHIWNRDEKTLLCRDLATETELMEPLRQEDFYMDQFGQLHMPRTKLPDVVPALNELGWEVVADGNAIRRASSFDIRVSSGQDWFDLNASASFDGITVMLPHLLEALGKGDNYVVLDDGSHGMLPAEWLSKFADLRKTGVVEGDSLRFTQTQALLLDTMLAEQEDVSLDRQFKAWCNKLNSFTGIEPVEAPPEFEGELREYQQLGLGWFRFLQDFRLGGCLADDMGLGKTIQVLAMLLQRQKRRTEKGETRKPTLIVVPKSLVFNWIEEAERFAPGLQLANYTGTTRKELQDRFHEYDAIVTTYGTMRNDVMWLREQEFDYVILDEAQAIKNPKSLSAKASRVIKSEHRLAMTGTPVENHLGDLWSLFDFLNPGMLGQTLGTANTAADGNNEQRIAHISNALRPFILRRTKEQVLTELPEKSEQTLYCDMEPKQRKLYNELRDHYRAKLTQKIEKDGLAKSKIQVLEALLRLRQASCDPRLVNPKSDVKGAKILRLVDQLDEILSEGHKALVFSQFTSLLSLVREEFDARGWDYEYLDGKTNKRAQHVERFQTDPNCSLFLISLKAGGSGLNLTAADYVFILDPWWNPAVEAQAIDRAHRMGQTKAVMAYRMICRETVEEKIVELQSSKRKLADAIISQEKSVISQISSDDLRMLFS